MVRAVGGAGVADHLVEQLLVTVQRTAHFFRCGVGFMGDVVPFAIMARDVGMIDRQVFVALIEIVHRIPARFHHAGKQPIAAKHRFLRAVDEQRFHIAPFAGVAVPLVGGQRTDVEFRDAAFALDQIVLRLAAIAGRFERAIVLVAVFVAQIGRPLLSHEQPDEQRKQYNADDYCENGSLLVHRKSLLLLLSPSIRTWNEQSAVRFPTGANGK